MHFWVKRIPMFVRSVGSVTKSGPVRSAVSDRSRTDLGPDRFNDIFRRRENFDDAKIFEKQVRNGAINFAQESSTSELSSRFLSRLKVENSLATFGRIQPIVLRFTAPYSGTNLLTIGRIRQKVACEF